MYFFLCMLAKVNHIKFQQEIKFDDLFYFMNFFLLDLRKIKYILSILCLTITKYLNFSH